MIFAVANPAVDGKVVSVSLWRLDFHLGGEPRIVWKQKESPFRYLYQHQLSKGDRAAHLKARNLDRGEKGRMGDKALH